MKYVLDTANIEFIKKAVDLYPISGVTTNPTIISKEKTSFINLLKDIRQAIGMERMLHVQAVSLKAETIVKEAEYIYQIVGGNFYIKIPVLPEGIKAIKLLRNSTIKVTATAVFTAQQALMAAEAGADFVAPYINRIDNICGDGVSVVSDIIKAFNLNKVKTEVLAASFKNVEQIHKVILEGAQSVTVNMDLFESLIKHPLTDSGVENFIKDWENQYGVGKSTIDVK